MIIFTLKIIKNSIIIEGKGRGIGSLSCDLFGFIIINNVYNTIIIGKDIGIGSLSCDPFGFIIINNNTNNDIRKGKIMENNIVCFVFYFYFHF